MASRPRGFGLTAELSEKIDEKYSLTLEANVVQWITEMTGEQPPSTGPQAFGEWLKDGVILCKLMNELKPNSCKPNIGTSLAFKQMENISIFLSAAEAYGVIKMDLFQTVDLYERENLAQVQQALVSLGRKAASLGRKGI